MSAKHTPGRIRYTRYGDIVTVPGDEAIAAINLSSDRHDEIGRRLAACWNVCDGISTEALQFVGQDLLDGEVKPLCDKLAEVLSQRDELLAALRQLLLDMVIAQGNMRDAAKRDPKWEGCAEAIQPRVDAAIAAIDKMEGGAV